MAGKKNHKSLNIAGIDPARRAALEAERDARRKAQASTPPKPKHEPAGKPSPDAPVAPSYEALPPPAISPRRSSSNAEALALPPLITGEEDIGDGFVLMRTKTAPAVKAPKTMIPTQQPNCSPPARTRLPVMSEAAALAAGLFSGGGFDIPSTFFTLEGAAMRPPHIPNSPGGGVFGALSTVSFLPFDTATDRSLPPLQRCASIVLFRGAAPTEQVARSFSAPPSFALTDNPDIFARTLPSPLPLPPPPHVACITLGPTQTVAVDELPSYPISRAPSAPLSFDDGTPQADASAEPKAGAPSPKRRLRSLTSALGAAAKLLAPRKARGRGEDTSDGGAAVAAAVAAEPACPGGKGGKRKGRGAAAAFFKQFMGCCSAPRVNDF
ncbi:hypothetical protein Rsub_04233 [Raphidocelis subcapitata]|uniref:Uncharacterized protein n=1 Tax=Raphidocelis subcapitata TaxID=307507 RepID=A0A2V0P0X0_9CHLO|nr:hypothetical protein Rsub_04233 [Raphidocelis subcapitata]|eukprot:GBF91493.1 hypothetical protein Rsub_04233 [Raphidocelis subcapitata]